MGADAGAAGIAGKDLKIRGLGGTSDMTRAGGAHHQRVSGPHVSQKADG